MIDLRLLIVLSLHSLSLAKDANTIFSKTLWDAAQKLDEDGNRLEKQSSSSSSSPSSEVVDVDATLLLAMRLTLAVFLIGMAMLVCHRQYQRQENKQAFLEEFELPSKEELEREADDDTFVSSST